MSNFTSLTPNWPDLYATACEAEQNVASTPGSTPLTLQLSHQASINSGPLSHRVLKPYNSTLDLLMSITYNLYKWRLSS